MLFTEWLEWPKLWNGAKNRGETETMNKKIFGFSPAFEIRTASDGNKLALEGRAIVFEQPTVLWEYDGIQYKEIIDSHALDQTDLSDVVLRYNHAEGFTVLARTRNRSMSLEKRPDGLYFRAELQPEIQAHRDLFAAVKAGLIDKMSFGFRVADNGDEYDSATHTRRIKSIKRIYDLSLVDFPAYEETFVEARSRLEQFVGEDQKRKLLEVKLNLVKARLEL